MLALIAGAGELPARIASQLGAPPLVCALNGFEPVDLAVDVGFRLETLGSLLNTLRENGVTQVCFAGSISRPKVDPAAIDAATMPLVPVLQKALLDSDDSALRAVTTVFEQAGFEVRAAHEIAPGLLPPGGVLTREAPSDADRRDAARGERIVAAMSAADIGQACVVLGGQAIAVESIYGTDWMLQSLAARPDAGGGVLFKAPKPDQDRRVDLPTIGPSTVAAACTAGLSGIAIEQGGVMVLDRAETVAECDRLGLFLWVREAGG